MAKKEAIKQIPNFKRVTCEGCTLLEPLERGLGWCKHKRVNAIQVVSNSSHCIFFKNEQG